jgi:hypothetical protein
MLSLPETDCDLTCVCANSMPTSIQTYFLTGRMLQVIWNDIDALGSCEAAGSAHGGASDCDFSWGRNFSNQGQFIEELHGDGPLGGRRYVVIFDPAIGNISGYPPYDAGKVADIFIKQGDGSGDDFVGKLWPGSVVWPSFINPKTKHYWAKQVAAFHKQSAFDGMWLDENEISNMELAHAPMKDCRPAWSQPCDTAQFCDLPYSVNNTGKMSNLSFGTIAADAIHTNGTHELREFDVHNLYGALETKASADAMRAVTGKRSFVISRSTFPGISGRSGGHWLGDESPNWSTVATSIPGVMTMGLFGIPLTGSDMHSGTGPADSAARVELAIRTLQVGALAYPFFRNHAGSSDGYFLPSNISGQAVPPLARAAITLRYDLLPHLYSLFVDVSRRGGTIITPLAFEFPTAGVAGVSTQFMLGGLMVCPVLAATLPDVPLAHAESEGVPNAKVECTFPQINGAEIVRWFDWHTLAMQPRIKMATVVAPIEKLPVFLRSGHVVVTQPIGAALTSAMARLQPFQLTVALAPDGSASGGLFLDDGESLDDEVTSELVFNASSSSPSSVRFASTVLSRGYKPPPSASLGTVRVLLAGLADGKPSRVTVSLNGKAQEAGYSAAHGVLTIERLSVPILSEAVFELNLIDDHTPSQPIHGGARSKVARTHKTDDHGGSTLVTLAVQAGLGPPHPPASHPPASASTLAGALSQGAEPAAAALPTAAKTGNDPSGRRAAAAEVATSAQTQQHHSSSEGRLSASWPSSVNGTNLAPRTHTTDDSAVVGRYLSRFPSALSQRRFGVCSHDPQDTTPVAPLMRTAFRVNRMGFLWEAIERSKGNFSFEIWDSWFASAGKNITGSYLILCYSNSLYTPQGTQVGPNSPEAVTAFVRFAVTAIRRYAGRGVVWELWNEPNGANFWLPKPNASAYAHLAVALGTAIRADPVIQDEVFVGPAAAGGPPSTDATNPVDLGFIKAVKDAGGLRYFDAVSVHPYCFGGPEQRISTFRQLRETLQYNQPAGTGTEVPLIAGEWGWSTCNDGTSSLAECRGGATADANTVVDQAAFLARQYLIDALEKVPITIWYDWADCRAPQYNATVGECNFGVVNAKGDPKLALIAAQTLERMVGSRTLAGRVLTDDTSSANQSFVLGFAAPSPDGLPSAAPQPELGMDMFAVWSVGMGDADERIVGTEHDTVCRGKIRSFAGNCSERCRNSLLCRSFVTRPNSYCDLYFSRCLRPSRSSACGGNCSGITARTLVQRPQRVHFSIPVSDGSGGQQCFAVWTLLGERNGTICANSGRVVVNATEQPKYLLRLQSSTHQLSATIERGQLV